MFFKLFRPKKRPSQTKMILHLLRKKNWVCSKVFYKNYIPHFTVRLNTLRKKGWVIESKKVKGSQYKFYKLIGKKF